MCEPWTILVRLVLTSSLFSFMHGPSNVSLRLFFLSTWGGLLLAFAYKRAKPMGFSSSHVLQ